MIVDRVEVALVDASAIGRMVGMLIAAAIRTATSLSITASCGRYMGWW